MAHQTENAWNPARFLASTLAMAVVGAIGLFAISIWSLVLYDLATAFVWDTPLTGPRRQIVSTFALGAGTAMTVAGYLAWSNNGLSFLDVERPTLRDALWTITGLVTLFVALYAISILFNVFDVTTTQHSTSKAAESNPALLLPLIPLSLLIIGPGEELLYRNVVQKALYDTAPRWAAVLTASIIFALVHIPAYSTGGTTESILATLLIIFTLSIILGIVYERTQNVIVPALVHGGYDAITFGLDYLQNVTGLVLPSLG